MLEGRTRQLDVPQLEDRDERSMKVFEYGTALIAAVTALLLAVVR